MEREDLLRAVAEAGYNVGFGAKRHLSTYDMVAKLPGVIGFVSLAIGIFGLFIDYLSAKSFSALFIVFGVAGIQVNQYETKKEEYSIAGKKLTELFNRLKVLYFNVKAADDTDLEGYEADLRTIEAEFNEKSLSDQILFSNWFAHYKFFWEQQIGWIEEQKKFRFLRDKVPLTLILTILIAVFAVLYACYGKQIQVCGLSV